jgi:hypothetical protein
MARSSNRDSRVRTALANGIRRDFDWSPFPKRPLCLGFTIVAMVVWIGVLIGLILFE